MDEEEILDSMPVSTDSRSSYINQSANTDANNGCRGKLNEAQLDERTILHAKRLGTGIPTFKEIVNHWHKAYGITIALSSEHTWVKSNQDRIDRAMAKLEANGDMPIVAVSNQQITGMLAKSARIITTTLNDNKLAQTDLVKDARMMTDPYEMIGCPNSKSYFTAKGAQREAWDKNLDQLIKLNNTKNSSLNAISKSTSDQGKVLVDLMKVVVELNKSGQNIDKMIEKKAREAIAEAGMNLHAKQKEAEVDPLAPVSDKDRID